MVLPEKGPWKGIVSKSGDKRVVPVAAMTKVSICLGIPSSAAAGCRGRSVVRRKVRLFVGRDRERESTGRKIRGSWASPKKKLQGNQAPTQLLGASFSASSQA